MAVIEAELSLRRCMTPSIAAPSGSKARMSEHRDVRVRAGPLGARSAGKFQGQDVAEIVMLGAVVLVTFAVTKVTRVQGRRAESGQGCHPHRFAAPLCPRKSWTPASAGVTGSGVWLSSE